MVTDHLKNIVNECPSGEALMGLDVGKKTIGVSVCDPAHRLATPVGTIFRKKFSADMREIEKIARDFSVRGFVIGYPVSMDGSEGVRCQSVRDFAAEFQRQISEEFKGQGGNVWVALWDERLSTFAAEDFADKTAGLKKRRAKESGLTDKLAACFILQSALDFMAERKE